MENRSIKAPTTNEMEQRKKCAIAIIVVATVILLCAFFGLASSTNLTVVVLSTICAAFAGSALFVFGDQLAKNAPLTADECEKVLEWQREATDVRGYVDQAKAQNRELRQLELRTLACLFQDEIDRGRKAALYGCN